MPRRADLFPVAPILAFAGLVACAPQTRNADQAAAPTDASQHAEELPPAAQAKRFEYPEAQRLDHHDKYHGIAVHDPYRWLEDTHSPTTRAWIDAENRVTFDYLEGLTARKSVRARLTKLWNYERWSTPSREGKRYVVSKNDGLQNQSVLYTLDRLDGVPKLLLDPNTLSADGTVALSGLSFSKDGERLAYGVSQSGSDWVTWKVRDVATAQDLSDELKWIKFSSVAWTKDNKGFFYARYEAPKAGAQFKELNYNQKIWYHRLGDPQSKDVLVYERPDHKQWGFNPEVSEDGRYLILSVRLGTDRRKSIFYKDLKRKSSKFVELLPGFTASFSFLGNDGKTFWFMTDEQAPRGRVIAIDIGKPDEHKEVIAQQSQTLRRVSLVGDRFIATYLDNAHSKVKVHALDGKLERDVALPGIGSVSGLGGKRSDQETFYGFTSFSTPTTVYRYDVESATSEVFRAPKVDFDPAGYETKQVFVDSRDGTKVPMFVTHKKGVTYDGSNPTYLYGYGGFNIPITPSFSVPNLVWMEMGGVLAVANLRGGGEFGEAWHKAGTKLKKQNVFDDFVAAATWLIDNKVTQPSKLAIGGRSNGGLLVGAAMTQRPDLFAAALPGVGVMDMLRFNQFTIGWAWESDYGSPQNPDEFAALLAYSPYHNLKSGTSYPATMVYTADHDDRVVPGHSFKFAAALQHAHDGQAPVLIRIDTKAGHGAGKPVSKRIEEWTDLWAFLVDNLDMETPTWR